MTINKLEFLHKYGTDNDRKSIPSKVEHLVKNLPLKFVPKDTDNMFNDERQHLAKSTLLSKKHIDTLLEHPDPRVREYTAANKNLTPKHVDHIMHNDDHEAYKGLVSNKHVKLLSKHLHKIIDAKTPIRGGHPAVTLSYHRELDDDHWDKIAKHPNRIVTSLAISGDKMPMKHLLTAALDHPDQSIRDEARMKRRENVAKGMKG